MTNSCPKYPDGKSIREERLERRLLRVRAEECAKEYARRRDGHHCRIPGCRKQKEGYALNVAHLVDKGMGGDSRLTRSHPENLACLCWAHHQGPIDSLHSKDLHYEFHDPRLGANGPIDWYLSDEQTKRTFLGTS